MLMSGVSSMITIKGRKAMEIFSPTMRKLWKEWELRALVLLSLVLQMLLIFFGNRRKFSRTIRVRFLLWCAYLMADWVATVALGVLLNNMGDVYEEGNHKIKLDKNTQLTAFWAPFLLLHLGGPDTITAYSLEDNELWLRHFLGLGVQSGVALYIFLLAWAGSTFSILTMPMFLAGFIKYGERTWSLRSSSNEELRDSMLTPPDPGPNYSKFMQEFTLRQCEGFHVVPDEVPETQIQIDVSSTRDPTIKDAPELRKADNLFKTFKRLFVDLILSFQDRDASQFLFKDLTCEQAFKVIEIELGFMYDLLYTKGPAIYSRIGCCLRFVSFASTCIVLVFFSLSNRKNCSKIDVSITFMLLIIAILLELYAALLLFSSDWADLYLFKQNPTVRKTITTIQLPKNPRWSNKLAQFNLLSYSLKSKPPLINTKIQKLFSIDNIIDHLHMKYEAVEDTLKSFLFNHLKMKFDHLKSTNEANYQKELKELCISRGARALEKFPNLRWSVDVEFDQSILIWHIATELCYYDSQDETEQKSEKCKISKKLSHYMLYLLVMRPAMLPMGIGKIRFQDTCAEANKLFQEHESISGHIRSSQNLCTWAIDLFKNGKSEQYEIKACTVLVNVNTEILPVRVKGDRSKSVLFDGCRLASELQRRSVIERWEILSNVWAEILAYAASHCRGIYHAQQLGRGGELLTHIWLLMAHFGLTEQFQISHGHARAKLIVE